MNGDTETGDFVKSKAFQTFSLSGYHVTLAAYPSTLVNKIVLTGHTLAIIE